MSKLAPKNGKLVTYSQFDVLISGFQSGEHLPKIFGDFPS